MAAAGINPLDHYHNSGWHEGRDPSAAFDTTLYLIDNPDVAAAGVDPLAHFLQFGSAEGRAAHEAVGRHRERLRRAVLPVPQSRRGGGRRRSAARTTTRRLARGAQSERAGSTRAGYLAHYTDVAAAGVNPLDHYETIGWKEGRDPSAGFDTLGYLAANPDVAAAGVNPLDHYLQFGIYEGRAFVSDRRTLAP